MSKWYEVKLTATKVVAVEVPDDIHGMEAMGVAIFDAITNCTPMNAEVEGEISSGPFQDESDEADSVIRHAEQIVALPEDA